MHFKHIAVVGVGLIGGSFALAARRAGIADRITGWDRENVLDEARASGVIDAAESFDSGRVSDADLVYLALPVGAIISFLRNRGSSVKHGAIVTDAGSTKRQICRVARETLSRGVDFVGGHPMAGSERSGVRFAEGDLFRGAAYALIADQSTNPDALTAVSEVVTSLGATPLMLTAEQHDRIAARSSHAPQMLSTALALAVARATGNGTLELAGSGLTEMTRLARSSWSVWGDICRTNADEIAAALDETISEIEAVRVAVSSGDSSSLREMFEAACDMAEQISEVKGRNA